MMSRDAATTRRGVMRGIALVACALVGIGSVPRPAIAQGLFGPVKFRIEQSDDRFSSSPTTTILGRNNCVSKKSPAGGVYINAYGVYLEPAVVKSRADGKVLRIGFFLHNETRDRHGVRLRQHVWRAAAGQFPARGWQIDRRAGECRGRRYRRPHHL